MDLKLIALNREADPDSFTHLYEGCIEARIRARYTLGQELSILRKRDIEPDEFREYYEYVEMCKIEVKEQLGLL